MSGFWHDVAHAYRRHIVDAGKEQAFWILVAFVATFVLVRVITHSVRASRGPFHDVRVGGTHVHHLVPGILLVLVTGYLSNAIHPRLGRTAVAVFFGIGAALTLDEFALWLNLQDDYWTKQGRESIDAVAVYGSLLLLALYSRDLLRELARI
jgi:hypothetical protein